jgi:hypothetical protein
MHMAQLHANCLATSKSNYSYLTVHTINLFVVFADGDFHFIKTRHSTSFIASSDGRNLSKNGGYLVSEWHDTAHGTRTFLHLQFGF